MRYLWILFVVNICNSQTTGVWFQSGNGSFYLANQSSLIDSVYISGTTQESGLDTIIVQEGILRGKMMVTQ